MFKPWSTVWSEGFPSIVNVLPEGDVMVHRPSQYCQCNPRKDVIRQGMNVTGVIWAHHAVDGRQ